MSIKSYNLKKKKDENLLQFDKRINKLSPVHAGYAYFGARVYDERRGFYGLYIEWNNQINSYMFNRLTEQGYVLLCSKKEAEIFMETPKSVPVYVRFKSKNGRIFAKDIYANIDNVQYNILYIGTFVELPYQPYFIGDEVVQDIKTADISEGINSQITNGSYNLSILSNGSFNISRTMSGSFNVNSFNVNHGSFIIGSFNLGSFNISSYNLNFSNLGSYNTGIFNLSSFNINSFNINNFSLGSFNLGSYNLGSFNLSTINFGSYKLSSFNLTGFNLDYLNSGSFNLNKYFEDTDSSGIDEMVINKINEDILFNQFYEMYGIGCLGYGLNLI